MRPQHITAENVRLGLQPLLAELGASMRPQHITAENAARGRRGRRRAAGFNEAAAYHCGKLMIDFTPPINPPPLQ